MNFIKPNLKSLPEQVDINTNEIKNLKSVLKSSYKAEKELETTTITIPITDTNAPQDTTSGWLYDSVGHLFSINGGDNTNLLLEYYTNFRGPAGAGGVPIVQTTGTDPNSVMSQNAVTTELESKANLDASNLSGENATSWANKFFPVGSIYMSVNNTSPASFLGGTWEQIKDRFLLGAGDTYTNGDTGGEATHTLTVDEMPSHNHAFMSAGTGGTYTDSYKQVWTATGGSDGNGIPSNLSLPTWEGIQGVQNTGGSQPHNNMPPYLVVYMWKRTA